MPTLREIATVVGCSPQAAHYRLHYLEKKGFWSAKRWGITEAGLREAQAILDRAIPGLIERGRGPCLNQRDSSDPRNQRRLPRPRRSAESSRRAVKPIARGPLT